MQLSFQHFSAARGTEPTTKGGWCIILFLKIFSTLEAEIKQLQIKDFLSPVTRQGCHMPVVIFSSHCPRGYEKYPQKWEKLHDVPGAFQRWTEYFTFIYLPWNSYTTRGVSRFGTIACSSVKPFSSTGGSSTKSSLKTAEIVFQNSPPFITEPDCKYRNIIVRLERKTGTGDHLLGKGSEEGPDILKIFFILY